MSQQIFVMMNLMEIFFLIEIHSMQGSAATTRHRVTRKRSK